MKSAAALLLPWSPTNSDPPPALSALRTGSDCAASAVVVSPSRAVDRGWFRVAILASRSPASALIATDEARAMGYNPVMAEIINLRQAKKRRAREEKAARAEENRVRFGRGKDERRKSDHQRGKAERDLDGKKLD